jgi:hyperosmotically inducible protein
VTTWRYSASCSFGPQWHPADKTGAQQTTFYFLEQPMKNLKIHSIAILLSVLLPAGSVAMAQNAPATWSEADTTTIVKSVQSKLAGLTDLGVFDDLYFGIKGKTIVLTGYASRPSLKSAAGNVIKGIKGVDSVDNQIEVLPLSPNDDRIRAQVYNKIYLSAPLRKYNANAGGAFRGVSVARMAGGITNDPPIGFHAIRIIVKNGNVILRGAVLNQGDSDIAQIMANSSPGVFSVTNELGIESSSKGK